MGMLPKSGNAPKIRGLVNWLIFFNYDEMKKYPRLVLRTGEAASRQVLGLKN